MSRLTPKRKDGYLPLEQYGALGDGRSVALCAADGSIDWWCVPRLDSPPLFDRLLDSEGGGYFCLKPDVPFEVERRYRPNSNVLETVFVTDSGSARLTESLNSGVAGRLPWSELARRIEGVDGSVRFVMELRPGHRCKTATSWREENLNGEIIHLGTVHTILRHNDGVTVTESGDRLVRAELTTTPGSKATIALLVAEDRPLIVSNIDVVDQRIDHSDREWQEWVGKLSYDGPYREQVRRSALALKLLWSSPTGAIAAAATTSLPEKIGGDLNYDYRFAWVRDAAYTIKAFLRVGALEEVQASLAWILSAIRDNGPKIHAFYTLDGELSCPMTELPLAGYRGSSPVHHGNQAKDQCQLGMYGDLLETVALFVEKGHLLDIATRQLVVNLVDQCADSWMQKDAGIWELTENRHYTMSKMSCWVALDRAVSMAKKGHLDATCIARWERERDRICEWVDAHCWSEKKQSYNFYAGTDDLDASILLATRFDYPRKDRLRQTHEAVRKELAVGELVYRYSGTQKKEGTFLACAFWMVEAYALLGDKEEARNLLDALLKRLDGNLGLYNEMFDPKTNEMLGNMPQCLSHLAMIHAAMSLTE